MGPKSFYTFLGLLLFIQGTSKEGANLIVLYCTYFVLKQDTGSCITRASQYLKKATKVFSLPSYFAKHPKRDRGSSVLQNHVENKLGS